MCVPSHNPRATTRIPSRVQERHPQLQCSPPAIEQTDMHNCKSSQQHRLTMTPTTTSPFPRTQSGLVCFDKVSESVGSMCGCTKRTDVLSSPNQARQTQLRRTAMEHEAEVCPNHRARPCNTSESACCYASPTHVQERAMHGMLGSTRFCGVGSQFTYQCKCCER